MAEDVATAAETLGTESGNGKHPAAEPGPASPPVPPPRQTSMKPVLVVVGIAVGLMTVFFVFSAIAGNGSSGTPQKANSAVPGTSLRAVPAASALAPIIQGGEPPSNIVNAVSLPMGSTRVSYFNTGAQAGEYDQEVNFSVPTNETEVFDFFRAEMHREGWSVSDAGPAADSNDVEVLGQKAGDDGWYWEMGATISPTTFGSTAAGPGTGAESTHFTVRLFQVPDDDS